MDIPIEQKITQLLSDAKLGKDVGPLAMDIHRTIAQLNAPTYTHITIDDENKRMVDRMHMTFLFIKAGFMTRVDRIQPIIIRAFNDLINNMILAIKTNKIDVLHVNNQFEQFMLDIDKVYPDFKIVVVGKLSKLLSAIEHQDIKNYLITENHIGQMTPMINPSVEDDDESSLIEGFLHEAYILGVDFNDPLNEFTNNIAPTIRHHTRKIQGKYHRLKRGIKRGVDSVGDTVVDGGKKYEIMETRKDILRGRKSFSSLVKIAVGVCMATASFKAALFGFPLIMTYLIRKRGINNKEKRKILAELKREKVVIQEKIRDADRDDNRKAKYNLMRLDKEMDRCIEQIRYRQPINLSGSQVGRKL